MIRNMNATDAAKLSSAFAAQGWNSRISVLQNYFSEQEQGSRFVFIAEQKGALTGYVTLIPQVKAGPFKDSGYPEIVDFNVFTAYQCQGIGNQLLAAAEEKAAELAAIVTLGVGLHPGYGAAQRLYSKRGFIPDGSGVWFCNQQLPQNATCRNNDELVLYLAKRL